jgi:uncharacterized membrane protein
VKSHLRGDDGSVPDTPSVLAENVQVIREWELEALHRRSRAERISDWVIRTISSGPSIALHVVWFLSWAAVNGGLVDGIPPFDRFPFPLLTMTVSLEAIFLTLFVLASQTRFAVQSDKRAHLDLQVNLLAEREMTAVLRLLHDIANHLEVKGTLTVEQINELMKQTDIHRLTTDVDKLQVSESSADESPTR